MSVSYNNLDNQIGTNVHHYRIRKNWKVSELADAAELDRQAIVNIEEYSQVSVSGQELLALAKALDIEKADLLGDNRKPFINANSGKQNESSKRVLQELIVYCQKQKLDGIIIDEAENGLFQVTRNGEVAFTGNMEAVKSFMFELAEKLQQVNGIIRQNEGLAMSRKLAGQ